MPPARLLRLVSQNILRNKKNFIFSSVGIIVGVTLFSFFLALAGGIRERVLNRVYPINQVEIEPVSVNVAGFKSDVRSRGQLDEAAVGDLGRIAGVTHTYPKQRSKLASMFKGGTAIFGAQRYFEAFFDGLAPALLWDELQDKERVEEKRRRFADRTPVPCEADGDCKPGFECREGGCRPTEYWRQFRYTGQSLRCEREDQCVAGEGCVAGRCERLCGTRGTGGCGEGLRCLDVAERRICLPPCTRDGDCFPGHACVPASCGDDADCLGTACAADGRCALAGHCRPLPCELVDPMVQESDECETARGRLRIGCDPTTAGETCPRVGCPDGTYCAAHSTVVAAGWCEAPVPLLLSPYLLEIYNSVAGPQMGAPRIHGMAAMLGVEMRMTHGESMITRDMEQAARVVKRCRLAGFSDKALDLGVTVPLDYVRRVNAHFRGRAESDRYDTAILQTRGNEDVSAVTMAAEARGFQLSRKSQDAKKAGTMLFVLTLVFGFISLVILLIAAINITHVFLMIIYERKHEIGILRAMGANRWDIRGLVLAEAGFIGLFGGALGNGIAFALSRLANHLAGQYLSGVPFRPEDLFVFSPALVLGSVGFALLFCLVGAFLPANRAARLDPAEVLTML